MKVVLAVLLGLLALFLAFFVLAIAAPLLIPTTIVLAFLVLRKPTGVGLRIREWGLWRRLPFLDTQRTMAGFVAVLLAYGVAAPGACLGVLLASSRGSNHSTPTSIPTSQATTTTSSSASAAADTQTSSPPPSTTPATSTAPVSTAKPTPPPTPRPTPPPTPPPTPVITSAPTPPPLHSGCGSPPNPFGYDFCAPGSTISSPPSNLCDYFNCIPSFWNSTNGYVEECSDGTYSHSGGRSGSCSSHGGNLRALLAH
jgi:hypothetical protein